MTLVSFPLLRYSGPLVIPNQSMSKHRFQSPGLTNVQAWQSTWELEPQIRASIQAIRTIVCRKPWIVSAVSTGIVSDDCRNRAASFTACIDVDSERKTAIEGRARIADIDSVRDRVAIIIVYATWVFKIRQGRLVCPQVEEARASSLSGAVRHRKRRGCDEKEYVLVHDGNYENVKSLSSEIVDICRVDWSIGMVCCSTTFPNLGTLLFIPVLLEIIQNRVKALWTWRSIGRPLTTQ